MKKDAKLFVIGASGYIGKSIIKNRRDGGRVIATSTTGGKDTVPFSLDRPSEFDFGSIQPSDVLLLPAAISAPDICANEFDRAWAVNVAGTSEFITKVMDRGGRVIFFSSDTVYGEQDIEFDEQAICNPAGEYAVMKHTVEKLFLGNPLFKSIRLSYVFSREDKFTQYLLGCVERGEEAELFHPFYRAIIHRVDVVDGALALARRWEEFPQSIINFGGPEVLARTEFAEIFQQTAFPNLRCRVKEPEPDFFRKRPKVIRMSSPVLKLLLSRPLHSLGEAMRMEFVDGVVTN